MASYFLFGSHTTRSKGVVHVLPSARLGASGTSTAGSAISRGPDDGPSGRCPRQRVIGRGIRTAIELTDLGSSRSQVLWSLRLSYQANRRGFFSWNSEDYRWIVFRDAIRTTPVVKNFARLIMTLFNLGFICESSMNLIHRKFELTFLDNPAIFQNILLAMLGVRCQPVRYVLYLI